MDKSTIVKGIFVACVILVITFTISKSYAAVPWTTESASQIGGGRYAIDVKGKYAYITEGYSLKIYDISTNVPVFKGSVLFTYIAYFIRVQDNYVYAYLPSGQYDMLLQIIDVSNPTSPQLKGSCKLNASPYTKSIGFYGNHVYVPGSNKVFVVDVSDKNQPVLKNTLSINATHLVIDTGRAYVVGGDKLGIYDLSSDSTNPQQIGTFIDTIKSAQNIAFQDNKIYISNYQDVQIIDVTNPSIPSNLGSFSVSKDSYLQDIFVYNGKVYTRNYSWSGFSGVMVFDVSNIDKISKLGTYSINSFCSKLAYPYMYVGGNGEKAFSILDVSNPQSISEKGYVESPRFPLVIGITEILFT